MAWTCMRSLTMSIGVYTTPARTWAKAPVAMSAPRPHCAGMMRLPVSYPAARSSSNEQQQLWSKQQQIPAYCVQLQQ